MRVRQADPVDWPGSGNTTHMSERQGFAIALEQGTVTITSKAGDVRLVPWSSCAFGVPAKVDGKKP